MQYTLIYAVNRIFFSRNWEDRGQLPSSFFHRPLVFFLITFYAFLVVASPSQADTPSLLVLDSISGQNSELRDTITINYTFTDAENDSSKITRFYYSLGDTSQWISVPISSLAGNILRLPGNYSIRWPSRNQLDKQDNAIVFIKILLGRDCLERFETGGFTSYPWQHSGNANWSITSLDKQDGIYSARSGVITDNQSTSLSLAMASASGVISFYSKVSSEINYDFLRFYIDTIAQGTWSGSTTWQLQTYPISAGSHTFQWTYSKDGITSNGSDCAWIDAINFPLLIPSNHAYSTAFHIDNNVPPSCVINSGFTAKQSDSIKIRFTLSDAEKDSLSLNCQYSLNGTAWNPATITGLPIKQDSLNYTDTLTWLSAVDLPTIDKDTVYFRLTPRDNDIGMADTVMFRVDNYHGQSVAITAPIGEQTGTVSIPYVITDASGDSITLQCYYSSDSGRTWNSAFMIGSTRVGPGGYTGTLSWKSTVNVNNQESFGVRFKTVADDGFGGRADSTGVFHLDNLLNHPAVITLDSITGQGCELSDTITVNYKFTDEENNSGHISAFYFGIGDTSNWNSIPLTSLVGNNDYLPGSHSVKWPSKNQLNGRDNTIYLKMNAEDSASNLWTTKASMPTARYDFSAAAINGKIYALGGYNYGNLSTVQEYDPVTNQWTTKASMPTARYGLAAAAINGKIYALGGYSYGNLSTVQEYDPVTNQWTTKASMPTARYGLAAAAINGKIYALGGYGASYSYLNTVEEYDPVTNQWTTKASMPTARQYLAAAAINGKIYAMGGYGVSYSYLNTVEEYDPVTNQWATKASMPTARQYLAAAAINGKIYALGGYGASYSYLNTVEEYDPVTNQWTTKASMPTARQYLAAATINGKIYALGGYNGSSYLNTVEEYATPLISNYIVSSPLHLDNNVPPSCVINSSFTAKQSDSIKIRFTLSDAEKDSLCLNCRYSLNGTAWSPATIIGLPVKQDSLHYVDTLTWLSAVDLPSTDQDTVYFRLIPRDNDTGATDTVMLRVDNYHGQSVALTTPVGKQTGTISIPYVIADTSSDSITLQCYYSADSGRTWNSAAMNGVTRFGPGTYTGNLSWNSATNINNQENYGVRLKAVASDGFGLGRADSTGVFHLDNLLNHPAVITLDSITGQGGELSDTITVNYKFTDEENNPGHISAFYFGIGDTSNWNSIPLTSLVGNNYYLPGSHSVKWPSKNQLNGRDNTIYLKMNAEDSASNLWTTKASMPTARYDFSAAAINGKIYAMGGYGVSYSYLNTVEEYDPVTNQWTTKASMPTARYGLAAAAINGKIYALGGYSYGNLSTVQEYDPVTNQWTTKASMPTARYGLAAAAINGKIYALGGYGASYSYLNTVEEYDPVTNQWTTKASMPTARQYLAAAAINGKIYALGGYNGSYLSTVQEYDPVTNQWTTKASMPTARQYLAVAAINGKIYALGGYNGSYLSTVQEYDPVANQWTTKASMPTARQYLAAAAINGKIYALGGYNASSYLNTVEEYATPLISNFIVSSPLHLDNNVPPSCVINSGFTAKQSDSIKIRFTLSDAEKDSLSLNCQYSLNGTAWNPATIIGLPVKQDSLHYIDTLTWLSNMDMPNTSKDTVYFRIIPRDNDTGVSDTVLFRVDNYHGQSVTLTTPIGEQAGTVSIPYAITDASGDSINLQCYYSSDSGRTWNSASMTGSTRFGPGTYTGNLSWNSATNINNQENYGVRFKAVASDGFGTGRADSTSIFHVDNILNHPFGFALDSITGQSGELSDTVTVNYTFTDEENDSAEITQFSYSLGDTSHWVSIPLSSLTGNSRHRPGSYSIRWLSRNQLNHLDRNNTYIRISLGARPGTAAENFETGGFTAYPWQRSGNANWSITSLDKQEGIYSARSGVITDNQSTSLSLAITSASGNISFYCKVSSESGYDFLRFYIDNMLQGSWSGSATWQLQTYAITAGSHTFQWTYSKDGSGNSGSDCACLDAINFPLSIPSNHAYSTAFHIDNNVPPSCVINSGFTAKQSDSIKIRFTLSDAEKDSLSLNCQYSLNGTAWNPATIIGLPVKQDSLHYIDTLIWLSNMDMPNTSKDTVYFRIIPRDNDTGVSDTVLFRVDNYHGQSVTLTTPIGEQAGTVSIPYAITDASGDSINLQCYYSSDSGRTWNSASMTGSTRFGQGTYTGNLSWNSATNINNQENYGVRFKAVASDGFGTGRADSTSIFHVDNILNHPFGFALDSITGQSGELSDTVTVNYTFTDEENDSAEITQFSYSLGDTSHWVSVPLSSLTGNSRHQPGSYSIRWLSRNQLNHLDRNNTYIRISLGARPGTAAENFETGGFTTYPWQRSGNANWSITSLDKQDGIYSARSGVITDNQSTSLSLAITSASGNISFYCKVSSESGYDFLRFYIDNMLQGSWSGSATWQLQTYAITAGPHTFQWTYSKDGSGNSGSDCAWIDAINFPLSIPSNHAYSTAFHIDNNVPPSCVINSSFTAKQSDSIKIRFTLSDAEKDSLSLNCQYSLNGTAWNPATIIGLPIKQDSLHYIDTLTWLSNMDILNTNKDTVYFRIIPRDNDTGVSDTVLFRVDNYHGQSVTLTTPIGEQAGTVSIPYAITDASGDSINLQCYYSSDSGRTWNSASMTGSTRFGQGTYTGNLSWNSATNINNQENYGVRFKAVASDGFGTGRADSTSIFHVDNILNHPFGFALDSITGQSGELSDTVTVNYTFTDEENDSAEITQFSYSLGDTSHWVSVPLSSLTGNSRHQPGSYSIRWLSRNQLNHLDRNNTYIRISLGARPGTAAENFETGGFTTYPWQRSGNANWSITSLDKQDGIYSARSGVITDNQSTSLSLAITSASGNISFYCKVSSESGYDFLRFYIDNMLQGSWSGSATWQLQTYAITAGPHTFQWTYSKDGSGNSGSDCAWIDAINFPLSIPSNHAYSTAFHIDNNVPPSCVINSSFTAKQSDSIKIRFTLSDAEKDSLSLNCQYSLNGTAWNPATIIGLPIKQDSLHYIDTLTWLSNMDILNTNKDTVYFRIIPRDNDTGVSDTVLFRVDNYHGQSVTLTTPIGEQAGTVSIPYAITDASGDSINLQCYYSSDSGRTWNSASMTGSTRFGQGTYTGNLSWNSATNINNQENYGVRFKAVASDGFGTGRADSITFQLDNNAPPSVSIPPVFGEKSGNVSIPFTLIDPEKDTLAIDVQYFNTDSAEWLGANVFGILPAIDTSHYSGNLIWISRIDAPQSKGDTILLRIIPMDHDTGMMDTVKIALVNYGLPEVQMDNVQGEHEDSIRICYTLLDDDSNTLSITPQYRVGNGNWFTPHISGNITDIRPSYYRDSLVWLSKLDLAGQDADSVTFMITVQDSRMGGQDTTGYFKVDNNLPPHIVISSPSGKRSNNVPILFTMSDTENDSLKIIGAEYSIDSQQTWHTAMIAGDTGWRTSNEYSGSVIWKTRYDLDSAVVTAFFRLTARDNDTGVPETSEFITLDNSNFQNPMHIDYMLANSDTLEVYFTADDTNFTAGTTTNWQYSVGDTTHWEAISSGTIYNNSVINSGPGMIKWNFGNVLNGIMDSVYFRFSINDILLLPSSFFGDFYSRTYIDSLSLPHYCRDTLHIRFSRPLDSLTLTASNIHINGNIDQSYAGSILYEQANGHGLLSFIPDSFYYSGESLMIEIDTGVKDTHGLSLVGDSATKNSKLPVKYAAPAKINFLADYNGDGVVDFNDLMTGLRPAYNQDSAALELGPVIGEIPHVRLLGDGMVDILDIAVFAQMWYWSAAQFAGKALASSASSNFTMEAEDSVLVSGNSPHLLLTDKSSLAKTGSGTNIRLTSQNAVQKKNQEMTPLTYFTLKAENVKGLAAAILRFTYDHKKLSYCGFNQTDFFGNIKNGTLFTVTNVDSQHGILSLQSVRFSKTLPTIDGSGDIIGLTFTRLQEAGDPSLEVYAEFRNDENKVIAANNLFANAAEDSLPQLLPDSVDTAHEISFWAYPVPARHGVENISFVFTAKKNVEAVLAVYDLMGFLVYTTSGNFEVRKEDTHCLLPDWDQRNMAGIMVNSGGYLSTLHLRYGDGTIKTYTGKLVIRK